MTSTSAEEPDRDSRRRPRDRAKPPSSGESRNREPLGSFLDLLEEADTLFLSREYERALEFVDKARLLEPEDSRVAELRERIRASAEELRSAWHFGATLLESGRPGEAIAHLRRASSLQPQNVEIRTKLAEAEKRHVVDRREAARALVRRKRFTAAADAIAAAGAVSSDEADRRREERCRRAAKGRRRLLMLRVAGALVLAPVLAFVGLEVTHALAIRGLLLHVASGDLGLACQDLSASPAVQSLDPQTRTKALDCLSTSQVRRALNEERFDAAAVHAKSARLDASEGRAVDALRATSIALAKGRLAEACSEVKRATESSSAPVRAAASRLLLAIRGRWLKDAVAIERDGRFAEEVDVLSGLVESPAGIKAGEEAVRLILARAVSNCIGLQAEAGQDVARWIELDDRCRDLAPQVLAVAQPFRERGGEAFSAAMEALKSQIQERLPDAARRRALAVRARLERAAPHGSEEDGVTVNFLGSVLDVRGRLAPESYRGLAASISTILR